MLLGLTALGFSTRVSLRFENSTRRDTHVTLLSPSWRSTRSSCYSCLARDSMLLFCKCVKIRNTKKSNNTNEDINHVYFQYFNYKPALTRALDKVFDTKTTFAIECHLVRSSGPHICWAESKSGLIGRFSRPPLALPCPLDLRCAAGGGGVCEPGFF